MGSFLGPPSGFGFLLVLLQSHKKRIITIEKDPPVWVRLFYGVVVFGDSTVSFSFLKGDQISHVLGSTQEYIYIYIIC